MSHHYIKFNNVHYTYSNGYEALKGVSFRITHGEKVALVGANGAGKSTLVLHTNGLLLPKEGSVNVGDIPIDKKTLPIVRQSVGLVFQNPDDQLFMPTVEEDVAFGPINMKLPPQEVERRVKLALDAVGASALRKRVSYQLSGGQKKSVAIATVLSMEPNILVMDEPSSNLDPKARRQIINLIRSFRHTCLVATHDLEMVWELCERTMVMNDGKVVADGNTKDIFSDIALLERCGLEQPYQAMLASYEINI
ncbi:energy-coupling factor ABC transporter ATP-binding protein [Bacteroides sp.]|uniref:energy-coupling factor ABC transporter ATP-binding protein n=1 Tax=Bacteroides sp. TaxID=29523 RepID=UPI002637073F|nr:ABC transporter ATP-binding protein [Bacteroides sp.]MDD3037561.1 ABC transporter ATP-binding protein [Bacteroides sp.]